MPERTLSHDTIRDSVASLRMAGNILRDLARAGALDDSADDLPALLAATYDEIVVISDDIGDVAGTGSAGASRCEAACAASRAGCDGVEEVLRLSEERLDSLARMIEGAMRDHRHTG